MTYIVIILTTLVSIAAFRNSILMQRLLLNPYIIFRRHEWYRLISHAFVHANFLHLIVNMIVLLSFGRYVESILQQLTNHWEHKASRITFSNSLPWSGGNIIVNHAEKT